MQHQIETTIVSNISMPIEVTADHQQQRLYSSYEDPVETITSLNNRGVAELEANNFEDALDCFQSSLSMVDQKQYQVNRPLHQKASTSEEKDSYIYQRREYDEGMSCFSDLIRMDGPVLEQIQSNNEAAAVILYNMGLLYLRRGQVKDEAAKECFVRALHLSRSSSSRSPVSIVGIMHNIGYIQYKNSKLEEALSTFNEALQLFRPIHATTTDNEKIQLAATLNCLGVIYFHLPKSDTSRALEYYNKSLEIRNQVFSCGSDNQDVATTLNNIGRVYYIKGEYDHALAKYLEALRIRRTLLGKDHLDVAATVYNAGQTFHQQGQLDKALKYYQEFMRITVPKLGQNHRDVSVMLKCMAQIYHEQKNYEKALKLYEEALTVGGQALGVHAEVASILNKMGNLFYEQGDFDNALHRYQQGLDVERAVLHDVHPNITVTLTNIGQIFKQKGEYTNALKMYKEALDIQVKSLGQTHPSVAVTLSNMGLIHYQNRSYSKSLDIYQEALRIRRDAYGESHLDVASSLNSIGLVLFKLGLHELAMHSFLESLKIRREILGEAHRDVAIILYNIATIHLERGDEEEAMKCYKETLRVERAALGPDHSDVILTLQYTAQVHQQRGELDEALGCYSEVMRIQQRNNNGANNDPAMARTLNNVANIYLQNGNTAQVVATMSEASRMMIRAGRSVDEELRLSGFHLYGFAILHPEAAASA